MRLRACRLFLILIIVVQANFAYGDDFSHAVELVKQNKHQQAYDFLVNEEGYHMGEPKYDLLLARTAMSSGHYHEAIFAFERVLIHSPGNQSARTDMAIAYYRIEEYENALHNLNLVRAINPNGQIRQTLDQYISLINEKINSRRNKLTGLHSFRQGWDSNINSATNESEIKLTIGTYTPTAGVDKQTSDSYSELINKVSYDYHLNVNSSLFTSAGYNIRDNNHKAFDTESADVRLGYRHSTSLGKLSIPIGYQTMWLDDHRLRNVTSIGMNLKRDQDKQSISVYTVQYGQIRYPGQPALDVDQFVLSYMLSESDKNSILSQQYGIFYGNEQVVNKRYPYNGREYLGIQARLPIRITDNQRLIPRLIYQQAEHRSRHPFFHEIRKDQHISAGIDWNWYLGRNWQINGQLSHSSNDSSVDLYTYDRDFLYIGTSYAY